MVDDAADVMGVAAIEIERLRAENERLHQAHQAACVGGNLLREEIERMRDSLEYIERMRDSLEYIVNVCPAIDPNGYYAHERARNALEGKP